MKRKLGTTLALVLMLGSATFAQDVRRADRRADRRDDRGVQQQQRRADDPPKADDKGIDLLRDLRDAIEHALGSLHT